MSTTSTAPFWTAMTTEQRRSLRAARRHAAQERIRVVRNGRGCLTLRDAVMDMAIRYGSAEHYHGGSFDRFATAGPVRPVQDYYDRMSQRRLRALGRLIAAAEQRGLRAPLIP